METDFCWLDHSNSTKPTGGCSRGINSCEVNQKHLLISRNTFRRGRPPFSPFAAPLSSSLRFLPNPHVARFSPSKACAVNSAKQRRNVDVGVEIGPMKAGSASNNLDPRQLLGRADCNPCKSSRGIARRLPSVNFTTNKSSPGPPYIPLRWREARAEASRLVQSHV